jgi:RNA polymerase sigma-70 factor (ECF subfamily)
VNYAAMSTEELVLACAKTNEALAWEEFVSRFHRLIAGVALRAARRWGDTSPQLIDELVQETYLKVCANDAQLLRSIEFRHPEAFCGFLKVLTANLVHDYFKGRKSKKRGGQTEMVASSEANVIALDTITSQGCGPRLDRSILVREIDDCLRSLLQGANAVRDRRIFWLYYRVGLSATAIAALPSVGLTTKGVESTLLRLTRDIRKQLVSDRSASASGTNSMKGIEPSESF